MRVIEAFATAAEADEVAAFADARPWKESQSGRWKQVGSTVAAGRHTAPPGFDLAIFQAPQLTPPLDSL